LDYDQQSSQSSQKNEEEELYKLLESSVPGLVLQREKSKADSSNIGTSKGMLDLTVTGHKLLVSPNPFNIVYLLPPTLAFLDRVKELIPYVIMRYVTNLLERLWPLRRSLRSWMTFWLLFSYRSWRILFRMLSVQ